MAHKILDRVLENSTTTGTGNITLSGAPTGYRSFTTAGVLVNDTFDYCIESINGEWEVGKGTLLTSTTFARTTITASSNGASIVNFSTGNKTVYIVISANSYAPLGLLTASGANITTAGDLTTTGNLTVNNITSSGDLSTGNITSTGHLTLSGNTKYIRGDFSNDVTPTNRLAFQSSTLNGKTYIPVVPNGTSTSAGIISYGNSARTLFGASIYTSGVYKLYTSGANNLTIGTNNTDRMTFGGSDGVTVNTSFSVTNQNVSQSLSHNGNTYNAVVNTDTGASATARFTAVSAGTAAAPTKYVSVGSDGNANNYTLASGADYNIGTSSAHNVNLFTGNTSKVSISTDGNVTQTSNQNATTHNTIVNTDSGSSAATRFTAVSAGTASAPTTYSVFGNTLNGGYVLSTGIPLDIGTTTANTLYLKTDNTTRLTIDTAGNTTSTATTFIQESTNSGAPVEHVIKNTSNTTDSMAMLDLRGGGDAHTLRFSKYGTGNSSLGIMVSSGGGNYQNLVYNTGDTFWSAYSFYPNTGGKQLIESSDATAFNGFGYGSGTGTTVSYAQQFNDTTVAAINRVNYRAEFQSTTFAANSVSFMYIPNNKISANDHIIITQVFHTNSFFCTFQAINNGSNVLVTITNPTATAVTFVPKFNICIIKGSAS